MTTPPKTEIERLQDLVSKLRQDLCNALMQSRRYKALLEVATDAISNSIWEGEHDELAYQKWCDARNEILKPIAALSEKEREK